MFLLSSPVEITNWPSYSINFTEFFFNNLLPILITGIFTLFITYMYNQFETRGEEYRKNIELLTTLILKYNDILLTYKILLLNYKSSFKTITDSKDYGNEFYPISMDFHNTDIYIQIVLKELMKKSNRSDRKIFEDLFSKFKEVAESTEKSIDIMHKSIKEENLKLFVKSMRSIPFSAMEALTSNFLEFRTR